MTAASRQLVELTSPECRRLISKTSILCLPLGAIEQHGPHLPLNTDIVVAEGFTRAIVKRYGEELDLWQLPAVSIGLSREHDWAAGTLSLSIAGFVTHLRELAQTLVRALPARHLVILNGHGGNRGVIENLLHELKGDFGISACAIHPFDLAKIAELDRSFAAPDVHGGRHETSVMLALAPDLVRRDLVAGFDRKHDAIRALIFDRGTTWPWRTDDPRLAREGVIGDATAASAELGAAIIASVVEEARAVLLRLLENACHPDDPSDARSR
jgi:creatinine amidohydrolase/Fe(II)-dependent formamide hydrolase-like protein